MLIKPGDYFCVTASVDAGFFAKFLAGGIKFITSLSAKDNSVKYSHAGIITSEKGDTFEALMTYRNNHLYNYKGHPVIIGRHIDMTPEKAEEALSKITCEYEGKQYPVLRLGLFAIPLLSKFIHFKPVCSELCFLHMELAKLRQNTHDNKLINYHWSINPDYLADAMTAWDTFEIVYEGIWE